MQGFGQHEPLIWLDLHGCSFVKPGRWRTSARQPYTTATWNTGYTLQSRFGFPPCHKSCRPRGLRRSEIGYRHNFTGQATFSRAVRKVLDYSYREVVELPWAVPLIYKAALLEVSDGHNLERNARQFDPGAPRQGNRRL